MAGGFEILIEDDETNTIFQYEKRVNKMKGSIRNLEDGKTYHLQQMYNSVGRDNCDINITSLPLGGRHAVIQYNDQINCFTIEDSHSPHRVYVNDCRIQNASVRLAHGDIIRFGHGGPRFDVLLDIQSNPPVVTQQAWNDGHLIKNSNLPYLPLQTSTNNTSKPYSTISYGRHNGYHGHNKPTEVPTNIVPHPPPRQRPVSANPANGVFLASSTRPMSSTLPKDYSGWKTSEQVKELESRLTKMGDNLNRLTTLENECYQKDNTIMNLQNEVDNLRRALDDYNISIADEHARRLAMLQSQVTYKDEEIRHLQDENRRLKSERDYSNYSTNQIADMKTQLSRHEQNIAMMETEMRKANQEKSQMAMLVNTLQKEITAKDVLLKKAKTETEKYKVDNRNKQLEISTLAAKIAKQTAVREAEIELKKREEEIGNLRYRLRTTEEKLNKHLSTFSEIEDSLSQSTYTVSEFEKTNKSLHDELQHSRIRCSQLERDEQAMRIELQNFKRKYDKFHKRIAEFIGQEGKKFSSVLEDEDVVNYIHELKDERDNAQNRLEEVLTEKLRLEEEQVDNSSLDMLRDILSGIEKRLIQNGRSCKYLQNELNLIQNFEVPDQLHWIKSFITALLSQEYDWEQEIENALESMIDETADQGIDPSVLIKRLHEKLNINANQIHDLEVRINSSEYEQSQLYNDLKEKIKEKYKKKTEKALKEYKSAEEIKFENRMREVLEEEQEKLSSALQTQKELYESELGSVSNLSIKIESLKLEHRKARDEFHKLQKDLETSRRNEASLEQKLKEKDMAFTIKEEILEKKIRAKEMNELKMYKDRDHEYTLTITSLENTILDINKEKKELEYQLMNMQGLVKEQKHDQKKLKKEEQQNFSKIKNEMKELNSLNQTLRDEIVALKKERDDHKEVSRTLKNDLEGLSAKLTDLKGELQEENKQKMESLEEKTKMQEKDLKEHRKQLLQMSALVEEQKTKIIEQDKKLMKHNNTLASQADGLRESQVMSEEKEAGRKSVRFDTTPPSAADMVGIAERCLSKRHEQVIAKQKAALTDLRESLAKLEHIQPPILAHNTALQHISEMKRENIALKAQLAVKENFSSKSDQELYEEVCRCREDLALAFHENNLEKHAHREAQEALHISEELYLRCIRTISTELDIQHILGCKPLGYVNSAEREDILKERSKALDIVLQRLKVLHSRLERKDNLLESYDDDLKVLRETEQYAGKKTAQVKNLEVEVSQYKDEISYLQEALKKCRNELDDQTRMNTALKQRKMFLMDYKEDTPPKQHNCYVDKQKKFKDDQKSKKKDELLKKRKFEIENLKHQLWKADMELSNANYKLQEVSKEKNSRYADDADTTNDSITELSYMASQNAANLIGRCFNPCNY
ncbi:forkhead-associated domain-containing protein 1-like isoform X2 [Hydractinia symbiolongicarpus]|uniref:forkhead-associated domain-containing protein 1-like isoform X2 n=1 Tax=Hydractinia symbiolongicarpus TaxID=13093 RepID=UPI00254C60B2|nr:forkhead-associated domain-containing protein 1-like isoform X2 [Hydractinia symbiolongicarpus]